MFDRHRLEFRWGGGALMLFGLPFLLAGLAVMSSPFWGPMKTESGEPAPVWLIVPFGFVFAAVGAALVFGRRGVVLDKRSGTAATWWGLLVPFRSTVHRLSAYARVELSKEIRRSDKSTYTVYPVRLTGTADPLDVRESQDHAQAHREAEQVAKFLHLPMRDTSGDTMVEREAGTLDESLRQRAMRTGERVERPHRPSGSRCVARDVGSDVRVDVPPMGVQARHLIMLAGTGLFLAVFVPMFLLPVFDDFGDTPADDVFMGFMALIGGGPIAVVLIKVALEVRARSHVLVSPRRLKVALVSPIRTRVVELPADEIEEAEVAGSSSRGLGSTKAVVVRTDEQQVRIGAGLPDAELRWLRDTLHAVLTGE